MKKGQVALEYMGILIVAIGLLIMTFYMAIDSLGERNNNLSASQAQVSVNDIASAVNFLCNKPEDSTVIVYAKIPQSVSLTHSKIGNNRIAFFIVTEKSNITLYSNVDCTINGTLPTTPGNYKFKVTKTTSNVNVTYFTGA